MKSIAKIFLCIVVLFLVSSMWLSIGICGSFQKTETYEFVIPPDKENPFFFNYEKHSNFLSGYFADKEFYKTSLWEKEMQVRMQEYSMPNANHELLKAFEGNWKTEVKFWMDPAGEPQISEGTAESKIIMGGRFLEQHFNGNMMGMPFEGRALWGYDNMKNEYQGLWFDNIATGLMMSVAKYDATAKTLTEEGSMSCPMTKETNRWYKAVTTFIDADNYTYESYMKDKDGKEFKSMMIKYSRIK